MATDPTASSCAAVIRIRQGDTAADPHFADPYDYVDVDTYLPGSANQLPRASSLEGVRLLALGSCLPEDAAAAPALAPPGQSRPPAPRRPVGVRLRSSSSRAEFSEAEDGVGGSPVVPWDPMAPPVALLGMRSPAAIAAREHDPVRGVRVGEVVNPGPRGGGTPRAAGACPGWWAGGLRFRGGWPGASHGGACRDGFELLLPDEHGLVGGRWPGGWVGRRVGLTLPPGGCPTWRWTGAARWAAGAVRAPGPPAPFVRGCPTWVGAEATGSPAAGRQRGGLGISPPPRRQCPVSPSADEAVWGIPRRRAGPRIAGALRWWAALRRRRVPPARRARWAGPRRRRVLPARRARRRAGAGRRPTGRMPPTTTALWKKCAPGGFAHKPSKKKTTFLHTVLIFAVFC